MLFQQLNFLTTDIDIRNISILFDWLLTIVWGKSQDTLVFPIWLTQLTQTVFSQLHHKVTFVIDDLTVSFGLYPVSLLKSFFYFIGLLVYPCSNTTLSQRVLVSGNVSHLLATFVFNYGLKNEDHIFLVKVPHIFRTKSKLLLGLTTPFMLWPLSNFIS